MCALSTGQRSRDAASKDAQNILRREEFALSTVPSVNYVVSMDARLKLDLEEYAKGMGRSATYAAQKDVQTFLSKEACALSMVHRVIHFAASKVAQINPSTEEYVRGMELRSSDAA